MIYREKSQKIFFIFPSLSLLYSLLSHCIDMYYNRKSIVVEVEEHFSVILSYERLIVILIDNLFANSIIIKIIFNIIIKCSEISLEK